MHRLTHFRDVRNIRSYSAAFKIRPFTCDGCESRNNVKGASATRAGTGEELALCEHCARAARNYHDNAPSPEDLRADYQLNRWIGDSLWQPNQTTALASPMLTRGKRLHVALNVGAAP